MQTHPLKGHIFESMVVTELIKKRTNLGLDNNLYYWRDKTGHEIDVIIDQGNELVPVEIKSGMTYQKEFFNNINYWQTLSGADKSIFLYAGQQTQHRSDGKIIMNWRELSKLEV